MKIGILQTGHPPEGMRPLPDLFMDLLGPDRFDYATWPVVDMVFPQSITEADGWLLTGSKHGAYEDLPFIPPLEAFIREAYAGGRPLVGICFGHQIIAQALGGRVEKFGGGWVVGRTEYDWAGASSLALNAWHQDQVVAAPEGAEVIAASESCAIAGLLYGDRAFSVQAHPEFGDGEVALLTETRAAQIPQERVRSAQSRIGQPTESRAVAEMITRFFTERRIA